MRVTVICPPHAAAGSTWTYESATDVGVAADGVLTIDEDDVTVAYFAPGAWLSAHLDHRDNADGVTPTSPSAE